MLRTFLRRGWATLLGALLLLVSVHTRADQGDPPEVEAQRLGHLMNYVAADYGGAVKDGAVTSQAEYDEQKSLLKEAVSIAERLDNAPKPATGNANAKVADLVRAVAAAVDNKASDTDVAANAMKARSVALAAFGIIEAPKEMPNPLRGKNLFHELCVDCHGPAGQGDGPKAKGLDPKPANYTADDMADRLSPTRVAATIRFGVTGTAMVPFNQLSDEDRYSLAFYVLSLRHQNTEPAPNGPAYGLSYLATHTDADIARDLAGAGVPKERVAAVLSDLRRRAPYEDRGAGSSLAIARGKIERARSAIAIGDRASARALLIDAYLEGIEPAEPGIRAADSALAANIEERYGALRSGLEASKSDAELSADLDGFVRELARAEAIVADRSKGRSFSATAISSAGIVLREGVEAALLIAALLGLAKQAGVEEKRRFIHAGWIAAVLLGLLTWLLSAKLVAISGARREMIEGVTALAATAVLFYVSYSLLAKREVARWMKFLKEQVTPTRAALSLFGVSFLAAYREAFETVLFYQALLASNAPAGAALVGAAAGALVLLVLVFAYSRAGRFAPPQVFFRVSSYLLYALAVVFAGQGVAALQTVGVVPMHPLGAFRVASLGIHPTVETWIIQLALIGAAVAAYVIGKKQAAADIPKAPKAAETAG
ncbi:MAG: FTR1 family protein [Polyangiaceae bacterium]|nr:FTR1 family protein [Polyangiaceae bacterium]